ncbi:unnamed protein product [Symbiodinium sp. CCMP2592]|nr:unnamed protein product [Symbiodinium sp. CCMP2592]
MEAETKTTKRRGLADVYMASQLLNQRAWQIQECRVLDQQQAMATKALRPTHSGFVLRCQQKVDNNMFVFYNYHCHMSVTEEATEVAGVPELAPVEAEPRGGDSAGSAGSTRASSTTVALTAEIAGSGSGVWVFYRLLPPALHKQCVKVLSQNLTKRMDMNDAEKVLFLSPQSLGHMAFTLKKGATTKCSDVLECLFLLGLGGFLVEELHFSSAYAADFVHVDTAVSPLADYWLAATPVFPQDRIMAKKVKTVDFQIQQTRTDIEESKKKRDRLRAALEDAEQQSKHVNRSA